MYGCHIMLGRVMMKTVLILDDEEVIRQSFVDYFEDSAWQTIEASSAEEALVMLDDHEPDAVVVDIRLPGMDGNDFIRNALTRDGKTAFVVCSGSPSYGMPKDLLSIPRVSGCFFRKPVTNLKRLEEDIMQTIEKLAVNDS